MAENNETVNNASLPSMIKDMELKLALLVNLGKRTGKLNKKCRTKERYDELVDEMNTVL